MSELKTKTGRRGGKRPGAGRKASPVKAMQDTLDNAVRQKIGARVPDLLNNLFALATGIKVQKPDKDGGVDVYSQPPDRGANEYLINRVLGKPIESLRVGDPEGEPFKVYLGIEVDRV